MRRKRTSKREEGMVVGFARMGKEEDKEWIQGRV